MKEIYLKRFSHLVQQWLREGKLYFSNTSEEELILNLEFPAGSEVIGAPNGGFSWTQLFHMAKDQGLLD
jgi:hypothetical protein